MKLTYVTGYLLAIAAVVQSQLLAKKQAFIDVTQDPHPSEFADITTLYTGAPADSCILGFELGRLDHDVAEQQILQKGAYLPLLATAGSGFPNATHYLGAPDYNEQMYCTFSPKLKLQFDADPSCEVNPGNISCVEGQTYIVAKSEQAYGVVIKNIGDKYQGVFGSFSLLQEESGLAGKFHCRKARSSETLGSSKFDQAAP
ncbi:MAG: hypothetical protein K0S29_221 [Gammaproteobacteria bacterium]|jgi:hypothetical protein|nr:hypothetical protein [Gammaproteobacteria bacterium]